MVEQILTLTAFEEEGKDPEADGGEDCKEEGEGLEGVNVSNDGE